MHAHQPNRSRVLLTASMLLVAAAAPALAGGTGGGSMPWSGPLSTLSDDLTGPTLAVLVGIAVMAGGVAWAFSDSQRGLLRVAKAVLAAILAGGGGAALFAALGISGSCV